MAMQSVCASGTGFRCRTQCGIVMKGKESGGRNLFLVIARSLFHGVRIFAITARLCAGYDTKPFFAKSLFGNPLKYVGKMLDFLILW